jgi:mannose-6-phosphate isomerase-like protein (cupin superfamily)
MLTSNVSQAVAQDEGQSFWFLGTLMTLKASAETTRGAFGLIEQLAPAGFAPPRHVHHAEDEAFYLLSGEAEFLVGDQTWPVTSGGYVYLPRDVPHSFRVGAAAPARLLQWTYPAGLENFFVELGTPATARVLPPPAGPEIAPAAIRRLLELAPKYHLEILA